MLVLVAVLLPGGKQQDAQASFNKIISISAIKPELSVTSMQPRSHDHLMKGLSPDAAMKVAPIVLIFSTLRKSGWSRSSSKSEMSSLRTLEVMRIQGVPFEDPRRAGVAPEELLAAHVGLVVELVEVYEAGEHNSNVLVQGEFLEGVKNINVLF